MRIWLSFFLISSASWASCDFRPGVKAIYSLSGPLTTAIKFLGLHQSNKLKGISSFYQNDGIIFHGDKIPGGSLLSPVTVRNFKAGIVFFDESQETEKILRAFGENLQIKKISTRNLKPFEVAELMRTELESVTKDCHSKLASFEAAVRALQKEILLKVPEKFRAVFFLGGFSGISTPDLVMANDGFVKWLREEKKILTYPTDLAYVPWSAKVMSEEMQEALQVGLVDSNKAELIKHGDRKYTCKFPRALTPGIDQLQALSFFLNRL